MGQATFLPRKKPLQVAAKHPGVLQQAAWQRSAGPIFFGGRCN
jgi:hypothetical protein